MKRIGRYIVRGLLGRGGMSRVYKAEIPRIGKIVALKRLDPHPLLADLAGADRVRDWFVSEALTLARLNHPHIVAIRDFDEAEGVPFYTMDYFFSNLGQLIGETRRVEEPTRPVRLDRAIAILRETLSGLACLHHHGIVHRDIKPYNLLLDDQDRVRIGDFGLSRLRGESVGTPQGLKVGSPWYAAPEQEASADAADARADLYAVSVTFYRMLTGRLPSDPLHPPAGYNRDLDAAWDGFIRRGLARNPDGRWPDAAAMLAALEALERRWQAHREQICRLPEAPPPARTDAAAAPVRLRSLPIRIDPGPARAGFGLDRLWRPADYIPDRFTALPDGTVRDAASGLIWQQSGSPYPLSWEAALAYAREVDRRRLAGRGGWRLPTTPELISLLRPTPHGRDFCVEPLFDRRQRTLWSADRRSFAAAWFADAELGFVGWRDVDGGCHARAVCSA